MTNNNLDNNNMNLIHAILSKPMLGFSAGTFTIILSVLHYLPLAFGIISGLFAIIAGIYSFQANRLKKRANKFEAMKNELEYEREKKNASK